MPVRIMETEDALAPCLPFYGMGQVHLWGNAGKLSFKLIRFEIEKQVRHP